MVVVVMMMTSSLPVSAEHARRYDDETYEYEPAYERDGYDGDAEPHVPLLLL